MNCTQVMLCNCYFVVLPISCSCNSFFSSGDCMILKDILCIVLLCKSLYLSHLLSQDLFLWFYNS